MQVVFVILFLVNNQLQFSKEGSKSNPLLVQQSFLNINSKYFTPHTKTRKTVNSMTPKSDRKWCEATPIIASHLAVCPFWSTIFPISHFGSAQEPPCPQSSAPLVVIHRFRYFYLRQMPNNRQVHYTGGACYERQQDNISHVIKLCMVSPHEWHATGKTSTS